MAINDYSHLPFKATGLSFTPTVSWTYTASQDFSTGLTFDIAVYGFQLFYPTTQATNDTTFEGVLEISVGSGSTVVAEVPFNFRRDSQAEHGHVWIHYFPEPFVISANQSIKGRVAASLLNLAYDGVKLMYKQTSEPATPTTKVYIIS